MISWKLLLRICKRLPDVVNKKVVKKAIDNKLNTKVNNPENEIPDATTLIRINQYNTGIQNLEKKIRDVDKKCLMLVA